MRFILFILLASVLCLSCKKDDQYPRSDDDYDPTAKGELTFWTNSDNGCGFMNVEVEGEGSKTITTYYPGDGPQGCFESGCANFNLNYKTYNYTAKCGSKKWSGMVNIRSECRLILLDNKN